MPNIQLTFEGKRYQIEDPQKDAVIEHGLITPYIESEKESEWIVVRSYLFWSARMQTLIKVPVWFVTDLSTIPKWVRWLISVNERHKTPSILHDALYGMYGEPSGVYSRSELDRVFTDFCELFGVPKWKCWAMYAGLRLGGRSRFKKSERPYPKEQHRFWYRNRYPELSLPYDTGSFTPLDLTHK